MSENEQKGSGKVIRTSSGSTRLTAGGSGAAKKPANAAASAGNRQAAGSSPSTTTQTRPAPPSAPAPTAPAPAVTSGSTPEGSGAGGSAPGGSGPGGSGPAPTQVHEPVGSGPVGSGPSGSSMFGSGPHGLGGGDKVRASSAGVKMSGKTKKRGPRTVKLTVGAIDPWSVMKMSFLMSVAIGIATIVAFVVLWLVLQATGVMDSMQATLTELAGSESAERVVGIFSLGRVLAAGFILALINMVLMTALSTLFAFLYNIGSSIAGGFHLTLTDD